MNRQSVSFGRRCAGIPSATPTQITPGNRPLTAAEFHRLADVPPEVEWPRRRGGCDDW